MYVFMFFYVSKMTVAIAFHCKNFIEAVLITAPHDSPIDPKTVKIRFISMFIVLGIYNLAFFKRVVT